MSKLIKPEDMPNIPKRWGSETIITNNSLYCGKKLFIKKDHYLSYHRHLIKDEVLMVFEGSMFFTYGTSLNDYKTIKMTPGEAFHVSPGLIHQMYAISDVLIIEFSTTHSDEDSYRTTVELVDKSIKSLL